MAVNTVHFADPSKENLWPACNKINWEGSIIEHKEGVTCKNCKRTKAYKGEFDGKNKTR